MKIRNFQSFYLIFSGKLLVGNGSASPRHFHPPLLSLLHSPVADTFGSLRPFPLIPFILLLGQITSTHPTSIFLRPCLRLAAPDPLRLEVLYFFTNLLQAAFCENLQLRGDIPSLLQFLLEQRPCALWFPHFQGLFSPPAPTSVLAAARLQELK